MSPSPRCLFSKVALACLVATVVQVTSLPEAHAEEEGGGMQSPGLFGVGLLFSGIGVAGLGVGGYFFGQGSGACDGLSTSSLPTASAVETCRAGVIQQVGGVLGMVGGGIFVIAGVPMIAVGATPEDDPPAPRIGLSIQPTGATFQMEF